MHPYNMTFGGSNSHRVVWVWPLYMETRRLEVCLSQQAISIFYLHKHEAPLGVRPKAGASLASPKGQHWEEPNVPMELAV